jgi:two-component system, chemotaxis family, protein-glutamate methylesterase/glutaminase
MSARAEGAPAPAREAIGICTSVGGPAVLARILSTLPEDFPLPILVVQHIASGFSEGLVRMLDGRSALPVAIARDGAPVRPGVWFAPDDAHLTVTPSRSIALDRQTVAGPHRPSADLLLESLATVYGSRAVGVVLTGMGRDGARGAALLHARGGLLLAQDEETSSVYGMPRAAVEAGAQPMSPSDIAAALRGL